MNAGLPLDPAAQDRLRKIRQLLGAPAMAGHLNIWETPLPLIQLTGAASAAIQPQSEFPMSVTYLGGVRIYPLYQKQADLRLRDINGSFKVSYGLTQGTMMLIRPDGYIAEIAKTDRINVLQRCAARLAPAPGGQR